MDSNLNHGDIMLRTHELHPTLVHFPLTLVPAALALDAIGEATDNEALMNAGKALMPIAAVSAAITGATEPRPES